VDLLPMLSLVSKLEQFVNFVGGKEVYSAALHHLARSWCASNKKRYFKHGWHC